MLVQNAHLASFPKRFRVGCVEELGLDTRQRAQAAFLSGPKQVNVSDLLVVPPEGSFAEAPNARRANADCGRCHKGCGAEIPNHSMSHCEAYSGNRAHGGEYSNGQRVKMLAAIAVFNLIPRNRFSEGIMNNQPPMPNTEPNAPAATAMTKEMRAEANVKRESLHLEWVPHTIR